MRERQSGKKREGDIECEKDIGKARETEIRRDKKVPSFSAARNISSIFNTDKEREMRNSEREGEQHRIRERYWESERDRDKKR